MYTQPPVEPALLAFVEKALATQPSERAQKLCGDLAARPFSTCDEVHLIASQM